MTTKYKIIAFDQAAAQITIRVLDMPSMVVDLPIDEDGKLPTGAELEQYLSGYVPTWHFDRQQRLANGVSNAQAIAQLVEPEPVIQLTNEQLASIARSTRDGMLAACDWTQVTDTALSAAGKAAWISYRQALRDVPDQVGFPVSIQWPFSPDAEPR